MPPSEYGGGTEAIVQFSQLDTKKRFPGVLVSSRRVSSSVSTEEIRELIIEMAAPERIPKVGQSFGVVVPRNEDAGNGLHIRLYSVADFPVPLEGGRMRIVIAVKRCESVDEQSGERRRGVASNYLCDLVVGEEITLVGPLGIAFEAPQEHNANLILVATSTGIAPFRAFVRHLYEKTFFEGRVWLFYGARGGLDEIYLNREEHDSSQYYDIETHEAFKAFSPRPNWGGNMAWSETISERAEEVWQLLASSRTYVYIAGLEKGCGEFERVLTTFAESEEHWKSRKSELVAGKRWVELLY